MESYGAKKPIPNRNGSRWIALLTTMIQCIVDRGLIHSSIDVLCKQVGISKTFFYTFFLPKKSLYWRLCATSSPNCCNMPAG